MTNYKFLQCSLKSLRNEGYEVRVKLNATEYKLQAEYNRLKAVQEESTVQEHITEYADTPTEQAELEPVEVETTKWYHPRY